MASPFCFVAERDGCCWGVTSPNCDVRKFYSEFAGYAIKPLASREDWIAYRDQTPFFEDASARMAVEGSRP